MAIPPPDDPAVELVIWTDVTLMLLDAGRLEKARIAIDPPDPVVATQLENMMLLMLTC